MRNCNNCHNRDKRECYPEVRGKNLCELRVPIGWQMVDSPYKMARFYEVMQALKLRVEIYSDGNFAIVQA